jgi:hypothetical protein
MNRKKCPHCGLVNPLLEVTCRRCLNSLADVETDAAQISPPSPHTEPIKKKRGAIRLGWILGTTVVLLFALFMSLLLTSKELPYDQRQTVKSAITVLEGRGFSREAFVLNHLVHYRATDNWWNGYIGHQSAYAATNFPFEVVTLYPDFFDVATDDTERAAILLHESHHLFGAGEETALEKTWREKSKLGWTADKYGATRVWVNTRDLTAASIPSLFTCGADGHSDCMK